MVFFKGYNPREKTLMNMARLECHRDQSDRGAIDVTPVQEGENNYEKTNVRNPAAAGPGLLGRQSV
jgi:hypothetical protein